jgi:hypothetical protein
MIHVMGCASDIGKLSLTNRLCPGSTGKWSHRHALEKLNTKGRGLIAGLNFMGAARVVVVWWWYCARRNE